jgi:hypothetical protein
VSASTTPIVLAGGMTMLSDYFQGHGVQYRVALGTGIAALIFGVAEPADPGLVIGLAWLAMVASLVVTRPNGAPSPVEVFLAKWEKA